MPLIDKLNDTALRSLKFGHDLPGGGSSNQPYIHTDLNSIDNNFNQLRLSRFDDGLIRGGTIGALNSSVTDTIRIGKFFKDIPRGPLFIAKQVGLQLSNPKIELKQFKTDKSGFVGNIINTFNNFLNKNQIGSTRIYNLGINTLAQIPVNAFGGHFVRHGLSPIQDENTKYYNVVKENDKNKTSKLIRLSQELLGTTTETESTVSNILSTKKVKNFVNTLLNSGTNPNQYIIDSYIGGPGSTYGIGSTLIKRYTPFTRTKSEAFEDISNSGIKVKSPWIQIDYANDLGKGKFAIGNFPTGETYTTQGTKQVSTKLGGVLTIPTGETNEIPQVISDNDLPNNPKYTYGESTPDPSYSDLSTTIKQKILGRQYVINGDNKKLTKSDSGIPYDYIINKNIIPNSKSNIQYSNYYGESVNINGTWANFNRDIRIGSSRQDSINQIPLIYSDKAINNININGKNLTSRDLIKFRFESVDTDSPINSTWMYFRAYLKGFRDSFSPEENAIKYIGRGENFYIYNGFTRDVSFNFQVAALSADEMQPMYQKLNYLASNTAPDYKDNLMRGNIMKLTIGNWFYRQPCKIKSLSYEVSDDYPWEIAIDEPENGILMYELPHIVNVSISFIPIGVGPQAELPEKSSSRPFVLYKEAEEVTSPGYEGIENPWLKQKQTNENLTPFELNGDKLSYSNHK